MEGTGIGRRRTTILALSLWFALAGGVMVPAPVTAAGTLPGSHPGRTVGSSVSRDTRTLSNGRMSVTVSLETSSGGARFVLDGIRDPVTGIELDLSASPVWQVMLGGPETPLPGQPFPADGDLLDGPPWFPAEQVRWGAAAPGSVVMEWNGLEVPGGQSLDVRVSLQLGGSDQGAEWNLEAGLSDGALVVTSAAFPSIELPGIGPDPSDDLLLHPSLGGSLVSDPAGCGSFMREFLAATGDPEVKLLYPGVAVSQFMALYDGELGLFMAAEDPRGTLKGIAFAPADHGVRLWLRTYNTTAFDEDRSAMVEGLRTMDSAALGESFVLDLFHGDWMTAADRYRAWARGADVPFLAHGPIATRSDVGRRIRSLGLMIHYGFGFRQTPVRLQDDERRLEAVIRFFREHEPDLGIAVNLLGVIEGREDSDVPRESWYGSAGRPALDGDLKAGVPELIGWLMDEFAIPAGHNRDTGGWLVTPGTTETALYDGEDALHRAIVRNWNGEPAYLPLGRRMICAGSQWQAARRLAINANTVLDSRRGAGFGFLIESGQGTNPKPCLAPLLADNPSGDHRHPPGGGTWWYERFAAFTAGLRSLYGEDAPDFVVIPEQDSEQLIAMPGVGLVAGKARQYPFSDDGTTQTGGGSLPCSQPVPLAVYLDHDFVLHGSRPVFLSAYIRAFGDRYAPEETLVPHPNYYRAVTALDGQVLALPLRSEVLAAAEDESIDGPYPERLCAAAREDLEFLRLLAETRQRHLDTLAWGRMLRFPAVATDTVTIEAYRDGTLEEYPVQAVVASAFEARDGTITLFAANHTRAAREYTLSFDPSGYGIPRSACWTLRGSGPEGETVLDDRVCGDRPYTSPALSLGPLSVQVLSLAPRTAPPRNPAGRSASDRPDSPASGG